MFDFIRKKRLRRAFNENDREHTFRSLETMRSVLLLSPAEDFTEIYKLGEELKAKGKKVAIWVIGDLQEIYDKKDLTSVSVKIVGKKDRSLLRIVKPEIEKEFKVLEYDTLIDFSHERSKYLLYYDYFLAISKAEFCIGCRVDEMKGVYDLTVKREKDQEIQTIFDQMMLFLQNIK